MDVSNVNDTRRHHSHPPSTTNVSAQTRQKIVEILAGTANGCLSEVGYFPGMPQRLKEVEHENEQWRLENMKLYQDNASLLELIHQQNERISQINTPDPEKTMKIIELDTELQKTRTQRDELARAQSAYHSTPTQLQQNFAHLQGDYVKVLKGYRSMCVEAERLQGQLRAPKRPKSSQKGPQPQTQHHPQQQPQQQSQQQNRPQIQHYSQSQPFHHPHPVHVQHLQSRHPAQRQSAPTLMQPHAQKYIQQQLHQPLPTVSRLQPAQQINAHSPPIFGQGQKYPLSQAQQVFLEKRHQSTVQNQQPRSRQLSGSMPVPSTSSGQSSFGNMANFQQPLFSSWPPSPSRPNSNSPHSNGFRAAQSTSPMVPVMPEPLATQSRTSFYNSGPPTPVVPSHSPLSQQFFAPPSSNFNPDPPEIAIPSSNKMLSTSIDPNTSTTAPPTISPHDTYVNPVNQVQPPQVEDVPRFNTNTTSAGASISPIEAHVAPHPVNDALSFSASIPHQNISLKRNSPTRSEGHHDPTEQLQKRPRLEEYPSELTENITMEHAPDDTEGIVQMTIDDDEDIVEVGADGLRLVKDCIFDLFGEEGEGRHCKLCIVRHQMGYRSDLPKTFVNATDDELQEHCVTEHVEAWDALRHSV